MYDNQWTDAFEVIDDDRGNEKDCIDALMALLMVCRDTGNQTYYFLTNQNARIGHRHINKI